MKCHLFFFSLLCLVPAQVTGLHVANQGTTNSLFTNWTQALGNIEFYQVLLIHENIGHQKVSVSSETLVQLPLPQIRQPLLRGGNNSKRRDLFPASGGEGKDR